MKFLIAPNAMKGSLSALHASRVIRKSLVRRFPTSSFTLAPIADGGNGTLECLLNILGGTAYELEVTGVLTSERRTARYGILSGGTTAVIESADVVGLHTITPTPQTVAEGTSKGIGELMNAVLAKGCPEILIGLGGTATNDGGAGMAMGLGAQMLNEHNEQMKEGCIPLLTLQSIVPPPPLQSGVTVTVLSDVTNPLLGPYGATMTYACQKGATEEQLPYLEAALRNFADVTEQTLQKDFRTIPGSGAAGGLGFGLMAFCGASLVSGIGRILDIISFDAMLTECDAVITAEGKLDEQTLFGKGIAGIAERAHRHGKPLHVFAGAVAGDRDRLMKELHLASLTEISPRSISLEEAMKDASWLLADAVFNAQL